MLSAEGMLLAQPLNRDNVVSMAFAVELDQVGAGEDPPVELRPQLWLKVVERKPGYALVALQRASTPHLQVVCFRQVAGDHRHVVIGGFAFGGLADNRLPALQLFRDE
jgi:hypothetical protein